MAVLPFMSITAWDNAQGERVASTAAIPQIKPLRPVMESLRFLLVYAWTIQIILARGHHHAAQISLPAARRRHCIPLFDARNRAHKERGGRGELRPRLPD